MKKDLVRMPSVLIFVISAFSIFTILYLLSQSYTQYNSAKDFQSSYELVKADLDSKIEENQSITEQLDKANLEIKDLKAALQKASKEISALRSAQLPLVVTPPIQPKAKPAPVKKKPKAKKRRIPYDIAPSQQ
jgi:hypothetical protein